MNEVANGAVLVMAVVMVIWYIVSQNNQATQIKDELEKIKRYIQDYETNVDFLKHDYINTREHLRSTLSRIEKSFDKSIE